MSFIHHLSVGHVRFAPRVDDPTWLTVLRTLDEALVAELLPRFADDGSVDTFLASRTRP